MEEYIYNIVSDASFVETVPVSCEQAGALFEEILQGVVHLMPYTAITTLAAFSFFFFLLSGSSVLLFACSYLLLSSLCLAAFENGWDGPVTVLLNGLALLNAALFTRKFLRTGCFDTWGERVLKGVAALTCILMIISLFNVEDAVQSVTFFFFLVSACLFSMLSYKAHKIGLPGARFLVVTWLSLPIIAVLAVLGAYLYEMPGLFILRWGVVLHLSLLILALGDRFFSIKKQKEDLVQNEVSVLQEKLAVSQKLIDLDRKHSYARALVEAQARQMASASHDIRQPLMVLKNGLEEVVGNSTVTGNVGAQLRESLSYLEALILRYLDPDVENNGPIELFADPLEVFPISVVLKNVAHMFQSEARRRNLNFRCVDATVEVRADPIAVMRIVSNFVSNAVKYTKPGSRILMGCRRNDRYLRVAVYDEGRGIAPEMLKNVVLPGVRGEKEDEPGNGMGLAIAKTMADDHGFTMTIRSEPGKGSLFAVDLPRA